MKNNRKFRNFHVVGFNSIGEIIEFYSLSDFHTAQRCAKYLQTERQCHTVHITKVNDNHIISTLYTAQGLVDRDMYTVNYTHKTVNETV